MVCVTISKILGQKGQRVSPRNTAAVLTAMLIISTSSWAGPPMHKACWFLCHHPPHLTKSSQITSLVMTKQQSPVGWWSRAFAVVTTPLKRLGIQGWLDYPFQMCATGTVYQFAHSSDGFCTVDMRLNGLEADGARLCCNEIHYLRVEVPKPVANTLCKQLLQEQVVMARGNLMWDADGFLEIHPAHPADISLAGDASPSIGNRPR